MRYLITGGAGFIGAAVCSKLLQLPDVEIIALDNINSYYNPALKLRRLAQLGIEKEEIVWNKCVKSVKYPKLRFIRMNLEDYDALRKLFENEGFDRVIHLAAQAGVRYSIDHPHAYIESNINGFINILECCRQNNIQHLIYASSSSVYGLNGKIPFSEKDSVNHPVSLYAATKKSNELMAHVYSHLYGIPTTGLRFFTVYGPWGRPDMSPYLFIDAIMNNRPIKVFNNGEMYRDFTYIDDIVEGVVRIADVIPQGNKDWNPNFPDASSSPSPYRIYNIGNSNPIKLMDYIHAIEKSLGKKAVKDFLPMQPGDVIQTYADSSSLAKATGFHPSTNLQDGINKTVEWFRTEVPYDQ